MLEERLKLKEAVTALQNQEHFDELALQLFRYQAQYNKVYRHFLELSNRLPHTISTTEEIPFLPISLFKNYTVQTGEWQPQ